MIDNQLSCHKNILRAMVKPVLPQLCTPSVAIMYSKCSGFFLIASSMASINIFAYGC